MYNSLKENMLIKIRNIALRVRLLFLSYNENLVIVTGCDSSHFKSLCQLLISLLKYESDTQIIIYDLGLEDSQRKYLNNNFSNMELRLFDYSLYPDYFNIKINAGEYAWKPVILNNVLSEFKCSVCWLDAGNVITKPLNELRKFTEWIGFYSPYSLGSISEWTHPKTLEYLKVSFNLLQNKNLSGGCVGVNYNNQKARDLIKQWAKFAQIKSCIAPEGSGRDNHRQDQSVLTILAYKQGIGQRMTDKWLGFKFHQDIDKKSEKTVAEILNNEL